MWFASGEYFLLQYDYGHFMEGPAQDLKNVVSRTLNRLGLKRFLYARPLHADRFEGMIRAAGFEVVSRRHEGFSAIKRALTSIRPDQRIRAEGLLAQFEEELTKLVPPAVLKQHVASVILELVKV